MSETKHMEQSVRERYLHFAFKVQEAGKLYTEEWELPRNTIVVKGIQLSSSHFGQLALRGTQKLEIGGEEIFSEGFLSRALLSTEGVNPAGRYFPLQAVQPGDLTIKLRYQDTDHPNAPFDTGYDVQLLFLTDEKL